ncbi:MAG TPA: hypothetical protein VK563_00720 [Puia sp.]|nr:hypothetical protein [Puia sp.]
MKAATIQEIKQELTNLSSSRLTELCLRLARYKKDNKELLTYLLFEAGDEPGFIQHNKDEIDREFGELPRATLYHTKKSLRKIVRTLIKRIKYTGSAPVEIELLGYFCLKVKRSGIPIHKNPVLVNLYQTQIKKIRAAIATLHEDLQYDYLKQLKELD